MIPLSPKLITAKIVLGLGIALLLSLGANLFLLKQWWEADAECEAKIATDNAEAVQEAQEDAAERDSTSGEITAETAETAQERVEEAQTETQEAQADVRQEFQDHVSPSTPAVVCLGRPVGRVQDHIEQAVRRANAAAR